MLRIYNIQDIMEKYNCRENQVRQMILGELTSEFLPHNRYKFKQTSPNTIEVVIEEGIKSI